MQRFHVAKNDTFPFLKLPPELRLMVYHGVCASMPRPEDGATKKEAEPTALFQVCREIRHETTAEFLAKLDPRLESAHQAFEVALREPVSYRSKEYQESDVLDAPYAAIRALTRLIGRCRRRLQLHEAVSLDEKWGKDNLDAETRALLRCHV